MHNLIEKTFVYLASNRGTSILIFFILCFLFGKFYEKFLVKKIKFLKNTNKKVAFEMLLAGLFFLTLILLVKIGYNAPIPFYWLLFSSSFVVGGILALIPFSFIDRRKGKKEDKATLAEIPLLVDSLQKTGTDGSFILFLFPNYAPGLQFSIEKGKLGIDYLLNSEISKKKKDIFIKIISELGCKYEERKMNGVEYIRIEGDLLVKNAQEMLRRMYQVKDGQKIDLVIRRSK